jgi:hypothetical protein
VKNRSDQPASSQNKGDNPPKTAKARMIIYHRVAKARSVAHERAAITRVLICQRAAEAGGQSRTSSCIKGDHWHKSSKSNDVNLEEQPEQGRQATSSQHTGGDWPQTSQSRGVRQPKSSQNRGAKAKVAIGRRG